MDYKICKLSMKETLLYVLAWVVVSFSIAFFFYRSVYAAIIIFLFFPIFLISVKKKKKERRKERIINEFKEMISFLSMSLQAGESVENAFYGMYSDMKNRFGEEAYMTKECETIMIGLRNNVSIEKLLLSLGERTDAAEIRDFAEIFIAAKRSGGNLKEIIGDTTDTIKANIEMKNEFKVIMASKRLEQRIMTVVPFGIVIYIGITSPGYFDSLYSDFTGRIVMTGCLLAYIGAFVWGEHILNLKI